MNNNTKLLPSPSDYTKENGHRFLMGSERIIVGAVTIYVHRGFKRLINYGKNNKLLASQNYDTLELLEEALSAFKELYKPSTPVTNHAIMEGDILVCNTNIDNVFENRIEFYQVTRIIDVAEIEIRRVESEDFNHQNFNSCIPMAGCFLSKEMRRTVYSNSVKIRDELLAKKLPKKLLQVADGPTIKVYEPQKYGLRLG